MSDGFVYFALLGDRVKIGWSRSPTQRAAALQAELMAVEPGSRFEEGSLHRRFAVYRVQGEWFDLTPEVREYIESLPSYRRLHGVG